MKPYLRIDPNDLSTLVAIVGEHILVALDAVGVVVSKNIPEKFWMSMSTTLMRKGLDAIPVTSEAIIAVVAEHFLLVKFFNPLGLFKAAKIRINIKYH